MAEQALSRQRSDCGRLEHHSGGGLPVAPPAEQDFNPGSIGRWGEAAIGVHDFYMFAQEEFAHWAGEMRDTIRGNREQTIDHRLGQDEGGISIG